MGKDKKMSFRIDDLEVKAIKKEAEKLDRPVSWVCREAVTLYLKGRGYVLDKA